MPPLQYLVRHFYLPVKVRKALFLGNSNFLVAKQLNTHICVDVCLCVLIFRQRALSNEILKNDLIKLCVLQYLWFSGWIFFTFIISFRNLVPWLLMFFGLCHCPPSLIFSGWPLGLRLRSRKSNFFWELAFTYKIACQECSLALSLLDILLYPNYLYQ